MITATCLLPPDVFPLHPGGSKGEDSVAESRGSDTMTLSKEGAGGRVYFKPPTLPNQRPLH